MKEMVAPFAAGDVDGARADRRGARAAYELLGIAINPIPIKAALNLLGHEVGGYRLPLVPPRDDGARARARLPRAALGLRVPTRLDLAGSAARYGGACRRRAARAAPRRPGSSR